MTTHIKPATTQQQVAVQPKPAPIKPAPETVSVKKSQDHGPGSGIQTLIKRK